MCHNLDENLGGVAQGTHVIGLALTYTKAKLHNADFLAASDPCLSTLSIGNPMARF